MPGFRRAVQPSAANSGYYRQDYADPYKLTKDPDGAIVS
jgi:hypothetical protein